MVIVMMAGALSLEMAFSVPFASRVTLPAAGPAVKDTVWPTVALRDPRELFTDQMYVAPGGQVPVPPEQVGIAVKFAVVPTYMVNAEG